MTAMSWFWIFFFSFFSVLSCWPWHFSVRFSRHSLLIIAAEFQLLHGFRFPLVSAQRDRNRTWRKKRGEKQRIFFAQCKNSPFQRCEAKKKVCSPPPSSLDSLQFFLSSTWNFTKTSSCHKKTVLRLLYKLLKLSSVIFHHNKP